MSTHIRTHLSQANFTCTNLLSLLPLRIHLSNCLKSLYTLKSHFVTLKIKSYFVILKSHFVTLKSYFVIRKSHFVTLKSHFVTAKSHLYNSIFSLTHLPLWIFKINTKKPVTPKKLTCYFGISLFICNSLIPNAKMYILIRFTPAVSLVTAWDSKFKFELLELADPISRSIHGVSQADLGVIKWVQAIKYVIRVKSLSSRKLGYPFFEFPIGVFCNKKANKVCLIGERCFHFYLKFCELPSLLCETWVWTIPNVHAPQRAFHVCDHCWIMH